MGRWFGLVPAIGSADTVVGRGWELKPPRPMVRRNPWDPPRSRPRL